MFLSRYTSQWLFHSFDELSLSSLNAGSVNRLLNCRKNFQRYENEMSYMDESKTSMISDIDFQCITWWFGSKQNTILVASS